ARSLPTLRSQNIQQIELGFRNAPPDHCAFDGERRARTRRPRHRAADQSPAQGAERAPVAHGLGIDRLAAFEAIALEHVLDAAEAADRLVDLAEAPAVDR